MVVVVSMGMGLVEGAQGEAGLVYQGISQAKQALVE